MNRENEGAVSVAVVGGVDGPTAVFGKGVKMPLRTRLKNVIYRYRYRRRKRAAEKKITAGTHTLDETVAYAVSTYGAVKVNETADKSSAVSRVYEINVDGGKFRIEIADERGTLGISFSGCEKAAKNFRKMAKDLHLYYGVSERDIREKTERYLDLLNVLSL